MNDQISGANKVYPSPFSLRLSEQERTELKRLADGRPLGAFIKDAIFKHGVRPAPRRTPPVSDQKLLDKLLGALGQSSISSNINQLAKAVNSGSLPVNDEVVKALQDAAQAIHWMRNTLIHLGLKPQCENENQDKSGDP